MRAANLASAGKWESVKIQPPLPALCSFWADYSLKQCGVTKDVRELILKFCRSDFQKRHTRELRRDRQCILLAFAQKAPLNKTLECLQVTTRLMRLEPGHLFPRRVVTNQEFPWRSAEDHCQLCFHPEIWVRVGDAPTSWPKKPFCSWDLESECPRKSTSLLLQ